MLPVPHGSSTSVYARRRRPPTMIDGEYMEARWALSAGEAGKNPVGGGGLNPPTQGFSVLCSSCFYRPLSAAIGRNSGDSAPPRHVIPTDCDQPPLPTRLGPFAILLVLVNQDLSRDDAWFGRPPRDDCCRERLALENRLIALCTGPMLTHVLPLRNQPILRPPGGRSVGCRRDSEGGNGQRGGGGVSLAVENLGTQLPVVHHSFRTGARSSSASASSYRGGAGIADE